MSYHAWKRRLWGSDYPIENGPPFLDGTGAPIFPGTTSGPLGGLDDDGPALGVNPAVVTLSGTATGPGTIIVMLAEADGSWAQANWIFDPGDTAADIAGLLALAFDALNPTGWEETTAVDGAITFTPDTARTVSAYVLYGTANLSASQQSDPVPGDPVPDDPTPPPVTDIQGPYQMSSGGYFWVGKAGNGQARIGFNTDQDPEPDIYVTPNNVAQDGALSADSKNAISGRLVQLGYSPLNGAPFS